ncbi:major centromere autoantigen B-like [Senna tora]|uniref:Major centromere autoantigen B-like n=1 Tax=Senna tora TaxID=362788 RepID=A0A834W5U6_9FABA|nr:major centromere autoantigen B-like [Senna tora]
MATILSSSKRPEIGGPECSAEEENIFSAIYQSELIEDYDSAPTNKDYIGKIRCRNKRQLKETKIKNKFYGRCPWKNFFPIRTRFEMGKEEYKIYIQQVNESQGFDVGTFEGFLICQIVPLDIEGQKLQEELSYYCEKAIQKTNYKLHEVVKANVQADRGSLFYITFKARSPSEENCVIFQAKVLRRIMNQGIEVRLCRRKPSNQLK